MVFKKETEGDLTSVKDAKIVVFSCPFDCMVTETKVSVLPQMPRLIYICLIFEYIVFILLDIDEGLKFL